MPDENPSGLGAFDLPLRLPGQYFDKETNLHYNNFRDYDPSLGIYKQSDLIGLLGGVNTYAYVGADPLRMVDPLGLATYMCTRPLSGLPFQAGPLYHQFICVGTASGGFTCGGLVPSGSMFDSPGVVASDKFKESCQLVQNDDDCVENCIKSTFGKSPPNYSVNLSRGENCQTYANAAVTDCVAACKVKKK